MELKITNLVKEKSLKDEDFKRRELDFVENINKLKKDIKDKENVIRSLKELTQNSLYFSVPRNQVVEDSTLLFKRILLEGDVGLKALSDIKKNLAESEKKLLDERIVLESKYSSSKESLANLTVNSGLDDLKVVGILKEYYFSMSHLKALEDSLKILEKKKKELQDYINQFI